MAFPCWNLHCIPTWIEFKISLIYEQQHVSVRCSYVPCENTCQTHTHQFVFQVAMFAASINALRKFFETCMREQENDPVHIQRSLPPVDHRHHLYRICCLLLLSVFLLLLCSFDRAIWIQSVWHSVRGTVGAICVCSIQCVCISHFNQFKYDLLIIAAI